MFSNMMVPLAGLCDTAFLGHLSDIHYLAGVILGSILFDYLYRILKFLRNSTNALTAQAVGADDSTGVLVAVLRCGLVARSEEHTSELQSPVPISYAVFCLKKKKKTADNVLVGNS